MVHNQNVDVPWWEKINPMCCSDCGNYKYRIGSTGQEHPCSIRCWRSKTGDCYNDPRKATVDQMKTRSILVRNTEPTKECAICLNIMKGPYVKRIFCGHTFHYKCLKTWEKTKKTCPLCRYNYNLPLFNKLINDSITDFNISYNYWYELVTSVVRTNMSEPPYYNLIYLFYEMVDNFEYLTYLKHIYNTSSFPIYIYNKYKFSWDLMNPLLSALEKKHENLNDAIQTMSQMFF